MVDGSGPASAEAEVAGDFGSLFIKADGTWEYRADAGIEAAPLTGSGETFRIQVRDTNGLPSQILEIQINIMGENDAPRFALTLTPDVGAVIGTDTGNLDTDLAESAQSHTAAEYGYETAPVGETTRLESEIAFVVDTAGEQYVAGTWAAADVDDGAYIRLFVNSVNLGTTDAARTYEGLFGDLVFNTDGTWDYTVRARAEEIAAGETPTDTFAITVQDEYGEVSNEIVLTINVTGRNDPPVALTGNTGTVTESGFRVDARHDFTIADAAPNTQDTSVDVASATTPPTDGFEAGDGVQASVTVHGVKFTARETGPAGNFWRVEFETTAQNSFVTRSSDTIIFKLNADKATFTSRDIFDLWNDHAGQFLKDMNRSGARGR